MVYAVKVETQTLDILEESIGNWTLMEHPRKDNEEKRKKKRGGGGEKERRKKRKKWQLNIWWICCSESGQGAQHQVASIKKQGLGK